MSRPLRALNAIAHDMGELNFSMRYAGKRRDEIGQLGATLNALTTKLENTITQLKGELSKEKTLEKMRTQFTAQVSHELQTPLLVIKGYAEALADNMYEDEEAVRVYGILLNETQKISDMVSDLLDLSQMEAGAYVLRKEDFDIAALLRKIHARFSALPAEKLFSMRLDADDNGGAMYFGDPLRIEQAVRNILTNAIKHVKGGGNIAIRLSRAENKTLITIENEGEPIEKDDLPHIFDSYYQGRGEKRGTGLGLAVTRHIIALHGGRISVRNTVYGVVFEIALP
ncbi:MAG: HAMP domain-containing sensor histidine kinase, partial [Eubacteriales bacterium]|nr:HAMP domain-containing sensor histidine kinase [Eubacteriales bacterium]